MLKSLINFTLVASFSMCAAFADGHDTTDVSWGDGTPGTLEACYHWSWCI